MSYEIAIFSYNRPQQLKEMTLATLERHKADFNKVTVFLANEEQRKMYENIIPDINYVIAERGKRRAIYYAHTKHYQTGIPLVSLDDDLRGIEELGEKKLQQYTGTIDQLADMGFSLCQRSGAKLWGLYPARNHFYMSNEAVKGLRYIIGVLWGTYAGDIALTTDSRPLDNAQGDDFETTLESFKFHRSVIRMEWLTMDTKYFAKGGIDGDLAGKGILRADDQVKEFERLSEKYPDWVTKYYKAGGRMNLRFKPITYKRYPRSEVESSIVR